MKISKRKIVISSPSMAMAAAAGALSITWLFWCVIGTIKLLNINPAYHLLGLTILSLALAILGLIGLVLNFKTQINTDLLMFILFSPIFHSLALMAEPALKPLPIAVWTSMAIIICRKVLPIKFSLAS